MLLKSIQKPCHIRDFSGKTLGVDGYSWLHKGAVGCAIDLALDKPTSKYVSQTPLSSQSLTPPRHVDFFMHRVRMLFHFGITPYIVFDGDNLPSKSRTEIERHAKRKEARRKGEELLRLGKAPQAYDELKKAIDVTPAMARQVIEELKRFQVKYVVAPFEADSQLVYLENEGMVNGIISEDSDLLVFGAKTLVTKLDQYGECIEIRQDDFGACSDVRFDGMQLEHFRTMAILSGCDYLHGIPKMGLKTAHRLVRRFKTVPNPVERIIQCAQLEGKFYVPPGYLADYQQAERTFLHQWVYCPTAESLVNLTPLPKDICLEDLPYIGACVEPAVAKRVANGDLDPMTKTPIIFTIVKPGKFDSKHVNPLVPKITPRLVPDSKARIDAFFRPSRIPLAELDPNTLTPSPSNRHLRNGGQGTHQTFTPAPSSHSVSEPRRLIRNVEEEAQRVTAASMSAGYSHPSKRLRMCPDDASLPTTPGITGEETSRFFRTVAISPTGERKKRPRSKHDDINIWSDDSLEDAMAAMPELKPALLRSKSDFGARKTFSVFRDEENVEPSTVSPLPSTAPSHGETKPRSGKNNGKLARRSNQLAMFKLPEPKMAIPPRKVCVAQTSTPETPVETSSQSPFHNNLMAETHALSAKYAFGHDSTQMQSESDKGAEPLAEPMTPPATSKTLPEEADGKSGPSSTVKETPLLPRPAYLTHKDKQPGIASKPQPTATRSITAPGISQPPHKLKAKGSEDLLIVPDSDESDASGLSGSNSPCTTRVFKANGENEDEDASCSKPMLNLKQFVFASA